jgi:hypothetical protein
MYYHAGQWCEISEMSFLVTNDLKLCDGSHNAIASITYSNINYCH